MSKKRKLAQELPPEPPKNDSVEISFSNFFHKCVGKGMVKSWQQNEIHEFFRQHGLCDKEREDKYLELLAKY